MTLFIFSCKGGIPNPTFKNGVLGMCPNTPNCVNSQKGEGDQKIAPLLASLEDVVVVITNMKNAKIVEQTEDYTHAEFTTRVMRYIDDVEFYEDPRERGVVHVRSASRVGHSDFGANRKRIELIRKKLAELKNKS